jgi:hypothetical protein
MWENIAAIHSVLKKKNTKLSSQSAQYKKNKIDKDNFRKKNLTKNTQKNRGKNHVGNTVAIHSVL